MFCPNCGKKIDEGQVSCPHCKNDVSELLEDNPQSATKDGEKKEGVSSTPNETLDPQNDIESKEISSNDNSKEENARNSLPETSKQESTEKDDLCSTSTESNSPDSPKESIANKFKNLKKSQRYALLGAGIATVALIVGIIIALVLSSGVPTDAVKKAFGQSSFVANGAVSGDYTNKSPYSITDFKIEKQEKSSLSQEQRQFLKNAVGSEEIVQVTFSGTMKNDSFETKFTGSGYFTKTNNDWTTLLGAPGVTSSETKPLKGVENFDKANSTDSVSYSDFSSSLDESGETYTSKATSTINYNYWFGKDTGKASQDFVFDPSYGWKTNGDIQIANQTTEYNLEGKTFNFSGDAHNGTATSSITFSSVTPDSASISYDINYTPNANAGNSFLTFSAVSQNGSASGKIVHTFAKENFTFQLTDSENSTDITISNKQQSSWNTTAAKNALNVSIKTDAIYMSSRYGNPNKLELNYREFSESVNNNA